VSDRLRGARWFDIAEECEYEDGGDDAVHETVGFAAAPQEPPPRPADARHARSWLHRDDTLGIRPLEEGVTYSPADDTCHPEGGDGGGEGKVCVGEAH